jgi:uncharacterized membrane protein YedE/YeeE
MKTVIFASVSGVLFGLGLCVSEMINPARVVGFLDVLGDWDSTLVFVMAAAVGITGIGFPVVLGRSKPLFADRFEVPKKFDIDARLLTGSVIFGVGWGLSGLCPGPAVTALASMSPSIFMFVAAMCAGQLIASRFEK